MATRSVFSVQLIESDGNEGGGRSQQVRGGICIGRNPPDVTDESANYSPAAHLSWSSFVALEDGGCGITRGGRI